MRECVEWRGNDDGNDDDGNDDVVASIAAGGADDDDDDDRGDVADDDEDDEADNFLFFSLYREHSYTNTVSTPTQSTPLTKTQSRRRSNHERPIRWHMCKSYTRSHTRLAIAI